MIWRIWNAYQFELAKALRTKSVYAGPVLVLLAVASTMLRVPIERDAVSDYRFVFESTTVAMGMLGLFLLVIFCATLVSSEIGRGTIRLVMVRPLRRSEFLFAKFMLGASYALSLIVLTAALSWGLAIGFGEVNGVEFGGELLYSNAEMARTYAMALGLGLLPLMAVAAYGLCVSTMSRHSGVSIGSAIGLWLLIDLTKYPLGIAPYMFSTYIDSPWQVFADRCDGVEAAWLPDAWLWCGVSAAWTFALLGIAMAALHRRSLQS